MSPASLDTEARGLLLQVAERHAFRHHAAVNLRGHGMQFLAEVSELRAFTGELGFHLDLLQQVEGIYAELGGDSLADSLQSKMERVSYPESRLELAACLSITRVGERAAARSYVECVHAGFADVSRQVLESENGDHREEDLLVELCRREDQREAAQAYWTRWLQLSLGSVGRLGTASDRRSLELGLRSLSAVQVVRAFLDDLEPLRSACCLSLPALGELGLELPEDLRGRFPNA